MISFDDTCIQLQPHSTKLADVLLSDFLVETGKLEGHEFKSVVESNQKPPKMDLMLHCLTLSLKGIDWRVKPLNVP